MVTVFHITGGFMYRTDLAYEANESLAKKIEGITLNTHDYSHGEVVELEITDKKQWERRWGNILPMKQKV